MKTFLAFIAIMCIMLSVKASCATMQEQYQCAQFVETYFENIMPTGERVSKTNHYNDLLQICFAAAKEDFNTKYIDRRDRYVADAISKHIYAFYSREYNNFDNKPSSFYEICWIENIKGEKTKCKNEDEFYNLILKNFNIRFNN